MKKPIIIFLILIVLIFLAVGFYFGFLSKRKVSNEKPKGIQKIEKTLERVGTIRYISLEGGFFGIETEKGERYLPLNLPEKFKKDGLKVWFKAKPKKGTTIQMWGKPVEILEIKVMEETGSISQIKVAILYQRISDFIYHPSKIRTYDDLVRILKETNPDLVFRIWWRWTPIPESLPSDNPVYQAGHTYQQLEETLKKLKKDLPEIKFWFGSIPTQRINFVEKNPITGKTYSQEETWQMALDPQKWGINFSKEKLQELAQQKGGTGQSGYLPDVTNEEFQELYLSLAKRQIDAGVNGLFLDMLFAQPRILAKITKDPQHPAVKESLKAIDYLIKKIRDYGKKKEKYIYLCSWGSFTDFPDYTPDLDFILITPKVKEIENLTLDKARWNETISKIKKRLPKAKILAMIDWAGTTNTPLGVFSQKLSKEEQREFLRKADEFFSKKGVIFIYPVHGGFMGQDAKVLSFGKLKTYDSLAPEFQTYETIKKLTQKKKVKPEPISSHWINEPLLEMIQPSKKGTLTLKEQEKMLPLLAEMGIKTVYLTPIWEMCEEPRGLKRYCIKNYYKIDPEKGTEKDLKEFVEKAHSYGIKVILDLVTAHTGPGRYIYENHKDWILKDKYGRLTLCWPHKHWGYAVDRKNPEVIEHFTKIAKYYVDEFEIDGWRVDAIGTMYCNESIPDCSQPVEGKHHSKDLLKSIKSALGKDKALYLEWCYLGRLYLFEVGVEERRGCPYPNPIPCSMALPELNEYADASYSYEFGKCFMKKVLAGKVSSKDFVEFFKKECLHYGKPRGRFLMTHDFGYQFYEKNPEIHKLGAVLITTIPGFPHIYHREIFPEGNLNPVNQEMFNFYKKLLKIREKSRALKEGEIENVWKEGDNVIAYLRKYKDEKVVVVVNFLSKLATSTLDLSFLPKGTVLYDELNNETFDINDPSNFKISVPKYGARILTIK